MKCFIHAFRVYVIVIGLVFSGYTSIAQWTQSYQPFGGVCYDIERVGNEIWAAYVYGVYVSTNEGITWQRHPTLMMPVMDIDTKGDTVIMLIQERPSASVYNLSTITSFDGGVTWLPPSVAETGNTYYTWGNREIHVLNSALIINNNSSNHFISHDFGLTWTPYSPTGSITCYNKNFLLSVVGTGSQKGNYYSADDGLTWSYLDSAYTSGKTLVVGNTFYFVSSFTDTSTHIFIARTSDFGANYDTLFLNAPYTGDLRFFNNKILFRYWPYPAPAVLYESADGGNNWNLSPIPSDLAFIEDDFTILLSNWDYLVQLGTLGMYRYNPTTGVYFKSETGIGAVSMQGIYENNGVLFSSDGNNLYRSSNAGATWVQGPANLSSAGGLAFLGDTVFTFTKPYGSVNNLCYSFNNGATWDTLHTSWHPYWKSPASIAYLNGKLYIGNSNFVASSSDFGLTWDSISTTVDINCLSGGFRPEKMVVCNNNLFVLETQGFRVIKLDTVTGTWNRCVCYSAPGVQYESIFSLEGKIVLSAASTFSYSADNGLTWITPARTGFPSTSRPRALYAKNGIWFAPAGSIYYSFNNGENWQAMPVAPGMSVNASESPAFTFLNEIMYASGNNIWKNNDTLNIISGKVFVDWNNNSVQDPGESGIANNLLYTTPNNDAFSTDSSGNYMFLTAAIGDTLRPLLPHNYCFSNPSYYLTNGPASGIDFGVHVQSGIQDLRITLSNRNPFRPGFATLMDIEVSNYGSVKMAGEVKLVLNPHLVYQNANSIPSLVTGDTIYFITDSLRFLEMQRITVEVLTPATDTIGTPVNCYTSVEPVAGDAFPMNNFVDLSTTVVGSFDPNDKSANRDPYFTPQQLANGEEMIYTIRFQNTGNFPADFVVITDTLSTFVDLSAFRVVASSHNMTVQFQHGRVVVFRFDNINLPPEIMNEPNSHGYVKFAVKFFKGLPVGTGIDNTANIYFDFNPPIITNTVSTMIADPPFNVGVENYTSAPECKVFPNPVSGTLNLAISGGVAKNEIQFFDQFGRLVYRTVINNNVSRIDVSHFANGNYFGRIVNNENNFVGSFRIVVMQ